MLPDLQCPALTSVVCCQVLLDYCHCPALTSFGYCHVVPVALCCGHGNSQLISGIPPGSCRFTALILGLTYQTKQKRKSLAVKTVRICMCKCSSKPKVSLVTRDKCCQVFVCGHRHAQRCLVMAVVMCWLLPCGVCCHCYAQRCLVLDVAMRCLLPLSCRALPCDGCCLVLAVAMWCLLPL